MSRPAAQHPSITLKLSGHHAVIEPDRFTPGSFNLIVDGTPQSNVNMDDPGELFFEYVQRIGHVIDLIGEVGEPITAVHLGAGALTLPRYVEATRPGSRQQVVELESDLIDFVRGELPWDKRAQLRVRHGDAREVLAKLPAGLHGAVDLVVVDIFSGARTDTMRFIKPDVSTICVGQAASMGSFLLAAGTKGKRYILPNSRVMIHQPSGGAQGQASDIAIQAKEILYLRERLNAELAKNTGQTVEKISLDVERDYFMAAEEAKIYGIVDSVLSSRPEDSIQAG